MCVSAFLMDARDAWVWRAKVVQKRGPWGSQGLPLFRPQASERQKALSETVSADPGHLKPRPAAWLEALTSCRGLRRPSPSLCLWCLMGPKLCELPASTVRDRGHPVDSLLQMGL